MLLNEPHRHTHEPPKRTPPFPCGEWLATSILHHASGPVRGRISEGVTIVRWRCQKIKYQKKCSYGRDPQRVDGFVQNLKADLEAAGISVWQDKEDIDVGSDWHNEIGDGVHECRALLRVLTNKYINSPYCKGELFEANGKKLIYPVLYEDISWDKDSNSRGVGSVVNSFNRADIRPGVDYQVAVRN